MASVKQWRDGKTAAQRGYGHRWRKVREGYLRSNPICVICDKQNRVTAATVVDHIKPHNGCQKLFWDKTNWQALCKTCHDSVKQSEEHRGASLPVFDADGYPLK